MLNTPLSVWVVFGTRPEAIKMLPLVRAMKEDSRFDVTVCITAQHREMLDQVMRVFDVQADIDLDVMRENQSLPELSSRIITGLDYALKSTDKKPDYLLVHGDTATTLSAALGAYFHQIPVGHVEAGLRTNNIYSPFPEEGNRKMTGAISTLHFAPTSKAESALLREGVSPEFISVTGNTVIDALKWVVEQLEITPSLAGETEGFIRTIKQKYSRYILVTGHRRENHGDGFKRICKALRTLAYQNPDTAIIYPVHPNPKVLKPVTDELGQLDNISLISPQEYAPFVSLMKNAYLILTDSGGVQEEAPSLGIPVLVMRDTTEREEAVEAGTVRLVGTDSEKIINEATILLNDPAAYDAMAGKKNPYGDGQACNRILSVLIENFSNQ